MLMKICIRVTTADTGLPQGVTITADVPATAAFATFAHHCFAPTVVVNVWAVI